MQNNQNNVEEKNKNKFQSKVDYLESKLKNLTKECKINKNEVEVNSHDIKKYKKLDVINEIKNEKSEENDIKEGINKDEKIYKKLSEIKDKIINLLEESKNNINQKYQIFSDNIINWHQQEIQKLSKRLTENQKTVEYIKLKILDKLDIIFRTLENIISALSDQLNLLDLFISDNLLENAFPLEEFLGRNSNMIINSNILAKIDLKPLNMNKILENKELSEIFHNYYLKRKYTFTEIQKFKLKIKSINDLVSTNDTIHEVYNKEKNLSAKVSSISFHQLNLSTFPTERIQYTTFSHLKKLKIKKCINLYNTNIYKSIINKSTDLKIIKLEHIQLTDKSLNEFFLDISKINSIINSINYLSFKNNYLISINLKVKKIIFNNIQMLDFSNNNIYYFSDKNFTLFPNLKIFDLSNNNINNNLLFEGIVKSKKSKSISFISLMSKNIFLYNVNSNNSNYIKYLNENLPDLDFNLKSINLSLVYNKYNQEELTKLYFSSNLKLSLIKINLSFCGLNDAVIFKFFSNNYDFINLKNLNLSHNFISVNFFPLFEDKNEIIRINKIKKLDLSFNSLNCENKDDLEKIYKFIDNHKFLKILKLQNNPILNLFKKEKKIDEYNDEIKKLINICENMHISIEIQTEIFPFIDNERFKKVFSYK